MAVFTPFYKMLLHTFILSDLIFLEKRLTQKTKNSTNELKNSTHKKRVNQNFKKNYSF